MTSVNIASRPDLGPLFGTLAPAVNAALLDRLALIDDDLHALAGRATAHVGMEYRHLGLSLMVSLKYVDLSGGPIGSAGDIWFELQRSSEAASPTGSSVWTLDSSVGVYCFDQDPHAPGACVHRLVDLACTAGTPEKAVEMLHSHVKTVLQELLTCAPRLFTKALHAELP
jgi:hypothetical protein